ncbi:hypothetical protein E0Z10_g5820 [Xylaria hypoxylon]|uniref:Uncharacterized protein n=1 Tax=Xylaria hypoxylon TaxID=37992 RepID=A0A4Z0YUW9_9PEZI|nr:hypothetical protein E0Z10_g5820 [Xylaria hypoxylon]
MEGHFQPPSAIMTAALTKTFEVVQGMAKTCPSTDEDIRRRCTYCEEKGSYTCNGCEFARYCSRECQTKDWPIHGLLCSNLSQTTRPSINHVRAILFAADEMKPRFIWIEQFSENNYFFPIIDCWLAPYARYANMVVDMNVLLEEAGHGTAGHGLVMIGIHEQPLSDVPVNASILTFGKPGQMKTWFGNQIIVGRRPNQRRARGITLDDVNFRDFRHAVDLYQHHPLNLCVMNPERYAFPIMPGVIIHCDGALRRFGRFGLNSRVESVVLRRDRAKNSSVTEDLCIGLEKLGLRWAYRQHATHQEWLDVDIKSQALVNLPAKHTVYRMDERSGRFCLRPVRNAGTIVVFDHSGSAIDPTQIRAVNAFFQHISTPIDEITMASLKNEAARQRTEKKPHSRVMIQPTAEGFKKFRNQWKDDEESQESQPAAIESIQFRVRESVDETGGRVPSGGNACNTWRNDYSMNERERRGGSASARRLLSRASSPSTFCCKNPQNAVRALSTRLATRNFHGTSAPRTDGVFSGLTDGRPRLPWIEAFKQQQEGKVISSSHDRKPEERDMSPKKMSDSYHRIVLPLGRDPSLSDTYINSSGHIRLGTVLMDLDALSGVVVYKHTGPGVTTVTAALDRIAIAHPLTEICDLEYSGQVTYASGRSSVEVTCKVARARGEGEPSKSEDVLLTCTFTMVALDPETKRPTNIPRLVCETPEEEKTFQAGKAKALAKKETLKTSLLETDPNDAESALIHKIWLRQVAYHDPTNSLRQPGNVIAMSKTALSTASIMQPQYRNRHQTMIFGGFHLKQTFELAFCCAASFAHARPTFISADPCTFRNPVPVGSVLYLTATIVYTDPPIVGEDGNESSQRDPAAPLTRIHVRVDSKVRDVEHGQARPTGQFNYTFAVPKDVRVLPHTYQEFMMYVDARRRVQAGDAQDRQDHTAVDSRWFQNVKDANVTE